MRTSSVILLPAVLLAPAAAQAIPPAAETTASYGADFFADKSPKTALDMINLLPGFTFSAGDPSLRGYAASVGNVLIDGQRSSDKQFSLNDVLSKIPADEVDHIEVIRGSRPGLDMMGQSVVANVVRKKGASDSSVVTLSDGQYFDGRNAPSATFEINRHFSGGRSLSGAMSLTRYIELAEGDGPLARYDASGILQKRADLHSTAGGITGFAFGVFNTPLWNGQLALNGLLSRTDYTYRERDRFSFPSVSETDLVQYLGGPLGGQSKAELGAHFNRSFGAKWTSENILVVNWKGQSYKSRLTGPGLDQLFDEHDHGGEALLRSSLRYAATPQLTARFALEGAFNWLHTTNSFLFSAIPIPLPNARATVSEAREQASAQVTWTPGQSLQFEFGLDVEHSLIAAKADIRQHKSLTYPKPRLAVTYTPNSRDQFRLRVEREVGQLDFNNYVASSALDIGSIRAGNTNIVPQQDWAFEAVYERRFWSDGDLSLTYRHLLISHALDRLPIFSSSGTVFDAPGNIGSGSEDAAIIGLTLPLDRLGIAHGQLKASGTFLWSQVTDPTTGAKRAITDLNPAEYSISFRQDVPRWQANWGASLTTPCATSSTAKGCSKSEFRFDEVDIYYAQPALNLFAEYQPQPGASIRLEADNVLQQRFSRMVQSYAGPRNSASLNYVEDRKLRSSPSVLISIRKAF